LRPSGRLEKLDRTGEDQAHAHCGNEEPDNPRRRVDALSADPAQNRLGVDKAKIDRRHAGDDRGTGRQKVQHSPWRLQDRRCHADQCRDCPGAEHDRHREWNGRDIGIAIFRPRHDAARWRRIEQVESDPRKNHPADDLDHAQRHIDEAQQQCAEEQEEETEQQGIDAGLPGDPSLLGVGFAVDQSEIDRQLAAHALLLRSVLGFGSLSA
jgi:hypothetical protein